MAAPLPVAVRLDTGVTLRGHEWPADGLPVLFVHDLGGDLDVWGPAPARLAASGFRVVSVELRGHGLSDGEPDPERVRDDVLELVREVAGSFGPLALVSTGAVSEAALYLNEDRGAPVHVVVSPQPLDPGGIDWAETLPAMRIVMVGTGNEVAHAYAREIYPKMRGQNLWVSTATADQGPVLLNEHSHILEQAATFIRRYLTPHHLAFIAEHADDIAGAAEPKD